MYFIQEVFHVYISKFEVEGTRSTCIKRLFWAPIREKIAFPIFHLIRLFEKQPNLNSPVWY